MVYKNQMKVQYPDCDVSNRIKISAAMRYMQQTSGDQLEHIGLPYEKLLEERMVFLLSKMCIKIHTMPKSSQLLTVGTAAVATKGARFVREFFIDDAATGERLLSALTLWLLVDPASRKILRPAKFPYPIPFNQTVLHNAIGDVALPRLTDQPPDGHLQIQVRYSHIDCNGHVNNSIYGDFICDALPHQALVEQGLDTLVISYQNEAKRGDMLEINTYTLPENQYLISGQHGGAPCFQSYVCLREKSLAHPRG